MTNYWIAIRFFNASVLHPFAAIDQCDRSDALDSLHGVTNRDTMVVW